MLHDFIADCIKNADKQLPALRQLCPPTNPNTRSEGLRRTGKPHNIANRRRTSRQVQQNTGHLRHLANVGSVFNKIVKPVPSFG
jgi:hypothetical protein